MNYFLTLLLTACLTSVQAKTLVAYYSYTGNCEKIANALASQITADLLEIQPAEKGLEYDANNYALGTQLLNAINANPDDAGSYPAIDPVNVSLSDYLNFTDNDISDAMKIRVSDGTNDITFELNETSAAKSLYGMLPLEVKVENYSNNEKIFYPPTTVSYGDDCIEGDCPAGTLALFSPWGNVVMYYGAASRYSGLYILGQAVEGADKIQNLSGTIRVEAVGSISGIQSMEADNANHALRGYAPNGMIAAEGQKGVVIKDGKKILVK